ncbi:MAG: hypothetical protein DRN95_09275 [Candidatus Hydrothermarchaeota archaeon]|nr:MAG: hypothetical protein DRN95_09275 [Candidatus Hydrothermarchaeota archaeon]
MKLKNKIDKLVDDAVKKSDLVTIDILWSLYSSLNITSKTGYSNFPHKFSKIFYRACTENIKSKHVISKEEFLQKFEKIVGCVMPDITKENYVDATSSLGEALLKKTKQVMVLRLKKKFKSLDPHKKKLVSIMVSTDFIKSGGHNDNKCFAISRDEVESLVSAIRNSHTLQKILGWTPPKKELAGSHQIVLDFIRDPLRFVPPTIKLYELEYLLVELGVGFFAGYVSGRGNLGIELMIVLELLESLRNFCQDITDTQKKKFKEVIRRSSTLKNYYNDTLVTHSESEIRDRLLHLGLDKLSEQLGLRLLSISKEVTLGNVGRADIIAEAKNGKTVIIEIKSGEASGEAVGQLLQYLTTVAKSGKDVEGVLIASSFGEGARMAAEGSKYKITLVEVSEVIGDLL